MSRPKPNKSSDLKKKNELNLETKTGPDRSNLVSFLIKLLAKIRVTVKKRKRQKSCVCWFALKGHKVSQRPGLGQAQGSTGALAPSH